MPISNSCSATSEETGDSFLYFAFGSNLLTDRIHINNPSAKFLDVAKLDGYQLEFNYFSKRWRGAAATVNPVTQAQTSPEPPSPGEASYGGSAIDGGVSGPGHVWGVLWQLRREDISNLDSQEGVQVSTCGANIGVYRPLQVPVLRRSTGERVVARTYQLIKPREKDRRPSKVYIDVIKKGAIENGLPKEYLDFLSNIEHNGYNSDVDLELNLSKV
uniref:gamma-glutamylcyclotransferase n=1 Tax=Hirondellea gigas TaxID=1518452 RepID=A0A6A7FNA9_9CRUS